MCKYRVGAFLMIKFFLMKWKGAIDLRYITLWTNTYLSSSHCLWFFTLIPLGLISLFPQHFYNFTVTVNSRSIISQEPGGLSGNWVRIVGNKLITHHLDLFRQSALTNLPPALCPAHWRRGCNELPERKLLHVTTLEILCVMIRSEIRIIEYTLTFWEEFYVT